MPQKPKVIRDSRRAYDRHYDAAMVKYYSMTRAKPLIEKDALEGSSPPGVFIGRYGYPKVYVGPLIPPTFGDNEIMDTPEQWQGRSIEEIVNFRFSLVRGKFLTDIHNFDGPIVEGTRETAFAKESADIHASFEKTPKFGTRMDESTQPFGPTASLKEVEFGNAKWEPHVEKAVYDRDLKAKDAVLDLYQDGVLVSKIQKSFSVGGFGIEKNRKFVPTRWSITAVDDTIGKDLVNRAKDYEIISEYEIYESESLDNRWIVILLPREWCYELMEAWYPDTLWNPKGKDVVMFQSHEFYKGRSEYADIGGCYYSARLAVGEHLGHEKKQAGAVILRETHPGYLMPVGVWNVRENVRKTLKEKPTKYATTKEVFEHVAKTMTIPPEEWIKSSAVLKDTLRQRRLTEY